MIGNYLCFGAHAIGKATRRTDQSATGVMSEPAPSGSSVDPAMGIMNLRRPSSVSTNQIHKLSRGNVDATAVPLFTVR